MAVRSVSDSGQPQVPINIPKLVTDPVASFKPWPINVRVGGKTISVPALSAADWLDHLMRVDDTLFLDDIFPGLLTEADHDMVMDAYFEGKIQPQDLEDIGFRVIEAASGRHWWVAMRIISVVRENWDTIGGEFALQGVNPSNLSLAGWLDAATLLLIRGMGDNNKINQFFIRLEKAPEGVETEEPTVDVDAFMSMM